MHFKKYWQNRANNTLNQLALTIILYTNDIIKIIIEKNTFISKIKN